MSQSSDNQSRVGAQLDVIVGDSPSVDPRVASKLGPYLRIYFKCAHAYTRVYRDRRGGSYSARCPRCGKSMPFAVGAGGTSERFFVVSCR
ncbi:MAG: hypothetical protein SFZ23_05235 [Planctomycetota bacterium]|nr:hypothetical protein [Planctomycetota bacterium]